MKWSFTSVGLIVFALVGLTILILFQNITTGNENDYYLLKEVTEASLIDAIDIKYYRETGELKIIKEKFVESFTRRFAESTVFASSDYTINYFDIMEEPPKVTVSINTGIGEYTIYQDTSSYNISNTLSAILEYSGKESTGWSENYVDGTPLVKKTFTKWYYSMPSSTDGNYEVSQPLKIPDELNQNHKNIYDLQISSVSNSSVVTDKGEILFAMLNREIDWVRTDGEKNQTNYYRNIDDMKIVDDISNIKIDGRECVTKEECDESKYWIKWTGNGNESPGVAVLKFEVTWSYNEYEYAE